MMYDQSRAQQPPGKQPGSTGRRTPGPEPLLPSDARAELAQHLQHALNTFADSPLEALEEAETAFDEVTAQLMSVLAERRRVLHAGWQDQDPETHADELRHALRQYREITQRLLRI
jgi:ABC-type transporter Mla subunit MlaD